MKTKYKKIFRSLTKILKNVSWPINICLKYLMVPTKTLQHPLPPSYILNVRSVSGQTNLIGPDVVSLNCKLLYITHPTDVTIKLSTQIKYTYINIFDNSIYILIFSANKVSFSESFPARTKFSSRNI